MKCILTMVAGASIALTLSACASGWAAVAKSDLAAFYKPMLGVGPTMAAAEPSRWSQGIATWLAKQPGFPADQVKASTRVSRTLEFLRAYYTFAETGDLGKPGAFAGFAHDVSLGAQQRACAAMIEYSATGDVSEAVRAVELNPSTLDVFQNVHDPDFARVARALYMDVTRALSARAFGLKDGGGSAIVGEDDVLEMAGRGYVGLLRASVWQGVPDAGIDAYLNLYSQLWGAKVGVPDPLHLLNEIQQLGEKWHAAAAGTLIRDDHVDDLLAEAIENPSISSFAVESIDRWRENLGYRDKWVKRRLSDVPTTEPSATTGP